MGAFKFSSLWLLFAVTYVGFFIPIFQFFPEMWLYHFIIEHSQHLLGGEGEDAWETILMLAIMLSALVVNLIFIFLSLTITQRLRHSVTSGFQHDGVVRISALKFSSLWLLFAVTYFFFYALIFSFFPEMWLHNLFMEHVQPYIGSGKWDTISTSAILLSALAINLVFIFLSLTLIQRLRNRKKRQ